MLNSQESRRLLSDPKGMVTMKLELEGKALTSYTAEFTVGLQLSDQFFVRIESPFTLKLPAGSVDLSPEEDPAESFQQLGELIGCTITESGVASDGTLSITFGNAARFIVGPNNDYEAWTVSGPRGMLVVCTPGGELAIWSGEPPEAEDANG